MQRDDSSRVSSFINRVMILCNTACSASSDGVPTFVEVSAPTDDELHALLHTVITRLMKMLTRHGVLIEEMGQIYLADPNADGDEARTLRPLQAAAITYRISASVWTRWQNVSHRHAGRRCGIRVTRRARMSKMVPPAGIEPLLQTRVNAC